MKRLIYLIFTLAFIDCSGTSHLSDNDNLSNTSNKSIIDIVNQTHRGDYKIFPIDESSSDSTLVEFLKDLKKCVSRKDTSELYQLLDSSIILSYGGGIYGIQAFIKYWELEQTGKSELWTILNRILNMGGSWDNDEDKYFCIPYAQSKKAFSKYKYDFDWYLTAVCISPQVTVYQEPKATSTKLAILSYDIVEMDPEFMKADFTKIHTIDKKIQGFVMTTDLIYSSDKHLVIKKVDNNWKITAFAPFD